MILNLLISFLKIKTNSECKIIFLIDSGFSSNKLNIYEFRNDILVYHDLFFYKKSVSEMGEGEFEYLLDEYKEKIDNHISNNSIDKVDNKDIGNYNIIDKDINNPINKNIGNNPINKNKNINMDKKNYCKKKIAFIGTEGLRQLPKNKILNIFKMVKNKLGKDVICEIISGVNEGLYAYESYLYLRYIDSLFNYKPFLNKEGDNIQNKNTLFNKGYKERDKDTFLNYKKRK